MNSNNNNLILKLNISNTKQFFKALIELMSYIPILKKLKPRERELIALFMYYNDKYKTLSLEDKQALIFSTNNRKKMYKEMKWVESTFNNALTTLRNVGLLSKENILHKSLEIYPDYNKPFSLTWQFKFNELSQTA